MPGSLFAVDVASLQAVVFWCLWVNGAGVVICDGAGLLAGWRKFAVIWLLVPFGLVGAGIWRSPGTRFSRWWGIADRWCVLCSRRYLKPKMGPGETG